MRFYFHMSRDLRRVTQLRRKFKGYQVEVVLFKMRSSHPLEWRIRPLTKMAKHMAKNHYRYKDGVITDPTSMPNHPGLGAKHWTAGFAYDDINFYLHPISKRRRYFK